MATELIILLSDRVAAAPASPRPIPASLPPSLLSPSLPVPQLAEAKKRDAEIKAQKMAMLAELESLAADVKVCICAWRIL